MLLFFYVLADPKQHQATYCLIERSSDSIFVLKALKQKLYIDGLAYLLQDIYGIENKHNIQHRVRSSLPLAKIYFAQMLMNEIN